MDIVEQLRALSIDYSVQEGGFTDDGMMLRDAADEIERMRAEIEQLRDHVRTRSKQHQAEIERLRSEIHEVHAHLQHYRTLVDKLCADAGEVSVCGVIGGLEAEIARLRKENKILKAADYEALRGSVTGKDNDAP